MVPSQAGAQQRVEVEDGGGGQPHHDPARPCDRLGNRFERQHFGPPNSRTWIARATTTLLTSTGSVLGT